MLAVRNRSFHGLFQTHLLYALFVILLTILPFLLQMILDTLFTALSGANGIAIVNVIRNYAAANGTMLIRRYFVSHKKNRASDLAASARATELRAGGCAF